MTHDPKTRQMALRLHGRGLTHAEIAETVNASVTTVQRWIAEGETPPVRMSRAEKFAAADWTKTNREIADATGFALKTVETERRWRSVDWSLSDAEVAERMGCTRQAATVQRKSRAPDSSPARVVEPLEVPDADEDLRVIVAWRVRAHRERRLKLGLTEFAARLEQKTGAAWTKADVYSFEVARTGKKGRRVNLVSIEAFALGLGCTPADLALRPGQTKLAKLPPGYATLVEQARSPRARGDAADLQALVGRNIGIWREHRALTEWELGLKITEIDPPRGLVRKMTWTSYEVQCVEAGERGGGRRAVTVDNLGLFAQALGVTEADLLRLPDQPALTVFPPAR